MFSSALRHLFVFSRCKIGFETTLSLMLLFAVGLSLASCGGEEEAVEPPPEPASTNQFHEPNPASYPEATVVYDVSELRVADSPVRLEALGNAHQTRKQSERYQLAVDGWDSHNVRATETIEELVDEEEFAVRKDIVWGLRGLLKISDRHKRTNSTGEVVDDWHNRITSIDTVEGDLFPIDYAKSTRLVFTSEMENFKKGSTVTLTNDYRLEVVAVLEADEYLSRMPFEPLRGAIKGNIYAVDLDWTFGLEGERQVTRSRSYFWSEDLGFTVPCCDGDGERFSGVTIAFD